MPEPIRIFIADDHALFRQGLRSLIGSDPHCEIVGEAACAADTLRQIRQLDIDVLIVDLSMPDNNGVEIVKQVRRAHAGLPILVLSMHRDGTVAGRAIKAGAAGYVTKDSDTELLLMAIRKLAQGGRFVDPDLVDSLVFQSHDESEAPPHTRLSDREYEIFKQIAAGKGLNEIAEQLHISPKTVSTYKNRLMQKLNAESVADLVRYAVQHQL